MASPPLSPRTKLRLYWTSERSWNQKHTRRCVLAKGHEQLTFTVAGCDHNVEVSHTYKHLGTLVSAKDSMAPEVTAREENRHDNRTGSVARTSSLRGTFKLTPKEECLRRCCGSDCSNTRAPGTLCTAGGEAHRRETKYVPRSCAQCQPPPSAPHPAQGRPLERWLARGPLRSARRESHH